RRQLDGSGFAVAELAIRRWASGGGKEYLQVAITGDVAEQFDAIYVALSGIVDGTTWSSLLPGLAERIASVSSVDGAAKLVAAMADRVARLPSSHIESMAEIAATLEKFTDVQSLTDAVRIRINGSDKAEMDQATRIARAFVDARLAGAADLVDAVV